MEALWNQVNLQPPPYRQWDVPISEYDPSKFIQAVDAVSRDFATFGVLHTEAALLSRLIYRMKSKFRSDKGLKNMEKVNRALLNYLNMSLHRDYELLKEYTEVNIGIVSLPSKQTLEYVLVRTQGFAKLMCRVESVAMTAASILQSRLRIGQAWTVATIAFAVVSRIWILSRYVLKKSCDWYNSIYKFTKTFKTVGISWLPDNYVLPKSLSKWLDLPWFSANYDKIPLQGNWDRSIFNLIQASDEAEPDANVVDDAIDGVTKAENNKPTTPQSSLIPEKKIKTEDFGKAISREVFEEARQKAAAKEKEEEKKVKKKKKADNGKKNMSTLVIKSEKDIVRLLTSDSFPGLDKLQWNILKKKIKKLLLKLTKNNTRDVDKKLCKKLTKRIENWTSSR